MGFNRQEYFAEYYKKNKRKVLDKNSEWQKKNPRKVYLYDVKRQYGLTEEEFEALPKQCEICGGSKKLCVDHSHKTAKARGRLCGTCNSALGLFQDDINLLKKAVLYMEKHNGS